MDYSSFIPTFLLNFVVDDMTTLFKAPINDTIALFLANTQYGICVVRVDFPGNTFYISIADFVAYRYTNSICTCYFCAQCFLDIHNQLWNHYSSIIKSTYAYSFGHEIFRMISVNCSNM